MSWKQTRNFNRNQTDLAGMCHRFVRSGYGIPAVNGYFSAWSAWSKSPTKHTDRNFPQNLAVPIWFSHYGTYGSPAKYDNWGHVVVWYPGVGYISSPGSGTGQRVFGTIGAVESFFKATYVGWTEDVNGYRVIEKVAIAANQRQVKSDSPTNIRSTPSRTGRIVGSYAKNAIITMEGFVYGEDYAGTNVWYKTDKGYIWAGSFTSQATSGLTDLTVYPEPEPDPIITTEVEHVVEEIPYETIYQETDTLPFEVEHLEVVGQLGKRLYTYEVTFTDGVETGRELISTDEQPPVNEVILVGTYVEPEPTPEEPDTPHNPEDDEVPTSKYTNWLVALIPALIAILIGIFSTKKEPNMAKENLPEDAPSQVKHPWNATLRTALQVILGITSFILLLAVVAPQILEAVADVLPENVYAWGVGAVASITALAGAITRIMAIPQINEWLKKIGLGVPPKDE